MKTLKFFLITILSSVLFVACEKSVDDSLLNENKLQVHDDNGNLNLKSRDHKSVPFKADFYTIRNYDSTGICSESPFVSFNYQLGEGNATHLGKIIASMTFCVDLPNFTYKNGEGVFVAANGDELYFWVPSPGEVGYILPYDHPIYEFQFQDPFTFNGGTGRFEGATGSGYTNSFVDLFDDEGNYIPEHRTDHELTGTLILPKKNK